MGQDRSIMGVTAPPLNARVVGDPARGLPRRRPGGCARAADGERRARGGRLEGARPLLLLHPAGAAARGVRVLRGALARGHLRRDRPAGHRARAPDPRSSPSSTRNGVQRAPSALERGVEQPELRRRAAADRRGCYRGWLARIVELVEEGRADGSVPAPSTPSRWAGGWRPSRTGSTRCATSVSPTASGRASSCGRHRPPAGAGRADGCRQAGRCPRAGQTSAFDEVRAVDDVSRRGATRASSSRCSARPAVARRRRCA